MLHQIGRHFGRGQSDGARANLSQLHILGKFSGSPPGFPRLARFSNLDHHALYFQRVIVIRVPSPGRETMSNSFTRRFDPPRPRPNPEPVVKPSRSASSTSGMPGP